MSKRSNSQKKRHTKPCRYFQVNKCPHPADVCDFAHIIVPPMTGIPVNGGPTMCRYLSAGRCTGGAMCNYPHGTETTRRDAVADWARSATDSPYRDSPPQYGYPTYNQGWTSSNIPFNSGYSPAAESVLFSAHPRSHDSIDTASNSISSADSDDVIVVTDDPQYCEHSHLHQSQVCVTDESPLIHVPPFYQPVLHVNTTGLISPSHVYDYGFSGVVGGMHKSDSSKPRTQSKSASKQKALKFKTKPCKFFTTERGCPNGPSCTFIHDEYSSDASSPLSSPVKYPSLKDDKSFFPIPWRVIGGGVRVAVPRDEDDSPSDAEENYSGRSLAQKPNLPPLKPISRKRSNSIPPTPSTNQIKVEHLFSAESPGVL